jgi:hypothetical protein
MSTETRTASAPTAPHVESTVSKSVRAPRTTWAKFTRRANHEGLKVNRVIIELMEGYAMGVYRLPKKKTVVERVYATPAAEHPAEDSPAA